MNVHSPSFASVFVLSLLLSSCQSTLAPSALSLSPPTAELHTTRWALYSLDTEPIGNSISSGNDIYLQLSATETRAEGQVGCNRFRGSFELPGEGKLRFGRVLLTKMACPELNVESMFMQALRDTRSYRISGDTLRLYGDKTAASLAELLATP
jgi:heat shock protein HslJ